MPDQVIKELWEIKDAVAHEHEYDIDALVSSLREKSRSRGHRTVNLERETESGSRERRPDHSMEQSMQER